MNAWKRTVLSLAALLAQGVFANAANPATKTQGTPANPTYVLANIDLEFPSPNAVDFYVASGTSLSYQQEISTIGYGSQGGFFATQRVSSVPSLSAPCLYVSNASTNDIAAVTMPGQTLAGNFNASQTDDGSSNGIGMAVNANYLYAGYTSSNTIATFALQSGCGLTFLGDVPALGLQGGSVSGMAVNAKILVVAYGDGSIQSFNVANGLPVSNNDLQNSTAYVTVLNAGTGTTSNLPTSVDLSMDGKYAIFGDISAPTTLEVSSLANGKIAKTAVYTMAGGIDAGSIRLSPDQSLIYISNSESGTVMAAFFNPATGKITRGCVSPTLNGFNQRPWLGSVASRDTTGTGNVVYVGEYGRDNGEPNHGLASAIGILSVTSTGASCTLTETTDSPALLALPGTLSIGVYPPRPF